MWETSGNIPVRTESDSKTFMCHEGKFHKISDILFTIPYELSLTRVKERMNIVGVD
jgi:hypothetical protein